MAETIQFNKGTMNVEKTSVKWEIPTNDIHCISTNELHYLKEQNHFSIPVNHIELDDNQLVFFWDIPETYRPMMALQKEDIWFQLKAAKSLLETIIYFEEDDDLFTVYDQANFYIDENCHVKILFFTKAIHLPYHQSALDHIETIRQILVQMFSKSRVNKKFIEQIKQSNEIEKLKQIVDDQYYLFLKNLDEEREKSLKRLKKTRRNFSVIFTILIIAVALTTYFLADDHEEVAELDEHNTELESKVSIYEDYVTSYNAYFSGNADKALKIANKLEKNDADDMTLNEQYYLSLLIDNGEIEQALEQYPNEAHEISEEFVLNSESDKILGLQTDNPYIKFEQAVFMDEEEIVDEIIP